MPSFLAGSFAVAGAVAALGPVLIHLLSRRRYREVAWGAMDLLREAAVRTRRSLRLRDLLLLVLRTACVLMFGLALARPYFSAGGSAVDPREPVHAILIIDNSLSMGYGELGRTLLDRALSRAVEFVDRLPEGSRISVVPLCGPAELAGRDAYHSRSDAREALAQIQAMDRAGNISEAIDLAREASSRVPDLKTKRIAFLGDQQKNGWPIEGLETELKTLPEFQVVPIQASEIENAWVESVRVQDGLADTHGPTALIATICYDGPSLRRNVRVSLEIEGTAVAEEIVDLAPGQSRQVRFMYRFPEPGQGASPSFVPVVVALTPDRLPVDDMRVLIVPVVSGLPVVFVDQYGAEGENPRQNRYGETYPLRRLLAPEPDRAGLPSSAMGVRHITIDRLDRATLQEARLVVVAGVESPGAAVPLLRQYVAQGGALLIAAGGRFSPAAWTEEGWRNGAGILPAPFDPEFVGRLPETSQVALNPFLLAPATMDDEFFEIDGASREELEDLYRTPVFFQAVAARFDESSLQAIDNSAVEKDAAPPARWLQWRIEPDGLSSVHTTDTAPGAQRPHVLARFSNQHPFLIRWRLGEGTVLVATSGIGSNWNNLPRPNAILLFDRLLR
ncbi:MAG TPA: BatA domain-containing protein, partial [Planctomycetaceae bacterium]|nr:BatA domain-containing protein [Planctomycetaceae bacterium]